MPFFLLIKSFTIPLPRGPGLYNATSAITSLISYGFNFLEKSESLAHDALLCIQTGKVVSDQKRLKMDSDEFYVKTPAEMLEIFSDIPDAVANSYYIANKVDLNLHHQGEFLKYQIRFLYF